jgi:hypothetical protein
MARKLLELKSVNNETIVVAIEVPESSVERVSRIDGDLIIERVDQHFDAVKDLIVRGCYPLTEAFKKLGHETQATNAEVEFGISFTAKGSVYVVESSGSASLKVKVAWNLLPKEDK